MKMLPGRSMVLRLACAVLLLVFNSRAMAAELLMFTLDGCASCMQFEADIGRIYARTAEAQRLPLRRIPYGTLPKDLSSVVTTPVHGTPTFVVIDDGQELGRIEGYRQDELFWLALHALLNRL